MSARPQTRQTNPFNAELPNAYVDALLRCPAFPFWLQTVQKSRVLSILT